MNANKLLLLLILFYKNTYNAHTYTVQCSLPCAYRTQCTGSKVWCPPKTEKKETFWAPGTDIYTCSIKDENKIK